MQALHEYTVEHEGLEALVDKYGLASVIDALTTITARKVQHLEENWQETDSEQVKVWKRNNKALDRLHAGLWRQSWER
jgi:hypothetical protein